MMSILSLSAGDIYAYAQNTKSPDTTDFTGRTAFGWTGVAILYQESDGTIVNLSGRFVPATKETDEYILLWEGNIPYDP